MTNSITLKGILRDHGAIENPKKDFFYVCAQVYFIAFQGEDLWLMSYFQDVGDLNILRITEQKTFYSFSQGTSLEFCPVDHCHSLAFLKWIS